MLSNCDVKEICSHRSFCGCSELPKSSPVFSGGQRARTYGPGYQTMTESQGARSSQGYLEFDVRQYLSSGSQRATLRITRKEPQTYTHSDQTPLNPIGPIGKPHQHPPNYPLLEAKDPPLRTPLLKATWGVLACWGTDICRWRCASRELCPKP